MEALRKTLLFPLIRLHGESAGAWQPVRGRDRHSSTAGITMIVAVAGSASAVTLPSELAVRPPTGRVAAAAMPRPAKLDRAIWLNTPSSPDSEATGAAATLVGSVAASVLIAGAAVVQPWGTDKDPTTAARPMAPDTGPVPNPVGLTTDFSESPSGANAPVGGLGPASQAAAPCPFWPQAYACPNDRNGPPGIVLQLCGENGPVRVDQIVFQLARSVESPGGNCRLNSVGNESPDNKFVDPVVGDSVMPVAKVCSAVGIEVISWDNCVALELAELLVAWVTAAACPAAPAGLVVCGGSVKGANCVAAADEPA